MEEIIVPNILVSITAPPKTGKTHLAMTFPAPLKIYSFDLGAKFVKTKFPEKQIEIVEYALPILESDSPAPWAEKIWLDFLKDYKHDAYSGEYSTLVIDTATALWGICRQAITEEKNRKRLTEVEYALPNLKMSAIFAHAKTAGVNLVTIQYNRDRYVKQENTGEKELDGWKQTEGQVDVVLDMSRVITSSKCSMLTKIVDNRFDRNVNGKVLTDTNYDEIYTLLGI